MDIESRTDRVPPEGIETRIGIVMMGSGGRVVKTGRVDLRRHHGIVIRIRRARIKIKRRGRRREGKRRPPLPPRRVNR